MRPTFRNVARLTREDVDRLVEAGIPEDETLDYKRSAYPPGERGKLDFCKDISALANTRGGVVLLGVEESDGIPVEAGGIEDPLDDLEQRLTHLARDGLDPPLRITSRRIHVSTDRSVLVLAVRPSRHAPHQVTCQGHGRFYSRIGSNNRVMTTREIRHSVLRSQTAEERAQERHLEHAHSRSDEDGSRMTWFLDLIANPEEVDVFDPSDSDALRTVEHITPLGSWPGHGRITFDGYAMTDRQNERGLRVLRDASVISWYSFRYAGPTKELSGVEVAELLERSIQEYVGAATKVGLRPPAHVCFSITDALGWSIVRKSSHAHLPQAIDRSPLRFPPLLIEDGTQEFARLIRPWLDRLWQASGRKSCDLFHPETGEAGWHHPEQRRRLV